MAGGTAADEKPSASAAAQGETLTWGALAALPLPPAGRRISYGEGPQQFGELRLPEGAGPFPVFVVIHGGCWLAEYDLTYITHLAAWLTERGFATWTIEYRRLGDEGGGWPGTFRDVAAATDALRKIAATHRLDLERVSSTGHSAGGQLALWLASRSRLAEDSELFVKDPVRIRAVLGLAAITDLRQYRMGPPKSCHASVEPLLGGTPEEVPERYAQTSPLERLPLGVPQVFIQGERDPTVSAESVRAYATAAEKAGDRAVVLTLEKAGHFETALPAGEMLQLLEQALQIE
ncbi:MAG: alpha/beta hydrolase [Chthoniobacterales bacterium]|nr:alpha/beta hydrolase [Chthoniobacterales bacterium]